MAFVNLLTKPKKYLATFRRKKSDAKLATDYEVHPASMLYRLCDWLGERTGLIILTPHLGVVGNCAEEVYFGLLKARQEGRKLLILWPYDLPWKLKFRLTNEEVVNIGSKYRAFPYCHAVTVAARLLLTAYFVFFRSISLLKRLIVGTHLNNVYRIPIIGASTLWQPPDVDGFSWEVVNNFDWPEQLGSELEVYVEERKMRVAEGARARLGLPADSWFVCLHVRESGFRDTNTYKEGSVYSERNADILNYIEAIKEITRRGGWVVRLGDASMTRLPAMERVIDYPFTEEKSALMDVYLISQCRLYIGMMTGIYDVARLFQRPMIMTNMNNWLYTYPIKKEDLGIAKHVYSKSKGRFLSLREWIAEPWNAVSYSHPIGEDYVFHENSPDELKAVVVEFFNRGDNFGHSELQTQFDDWRIKRGRDIVSERMFLPEDVQLYYRKNITDYDLLERYRLASRLESAVGCMGSEFLHKNWESNVRNSQ